MGQLGYTQGDLGWSELSTSNADAAVKFYLAVVGWENKGEPCPGYHVVGRGDEMLAGISKIDGGNKTPGWMPYITVDDLDAALAKVEKLGGSICQQATPLPEDSGRIAIIKDPQGVTTGLAQYTKKS